MARILDFYDVRWEYEPHVFPILWNVDGDVVESFAPDFWLPDLDLYLEMTTLKQRLVRRKNRKLRRVRELYPDLRVKLFYARDFRALMLKYGKLALADALSGTLGQVPPVRQRSAVVEATDVPIERLPGTEPVSAPDEGPGRGGTPGPAVASPLVAHRTTTGTARRRRARRRSARQAAEAQALAGATA